MSAPFHVHVHSNAVMNTACTHEQRWFITARRCVRAMYRCNQASIRVHSTP
jgi:hypothetical protein